MSFNRRGGPDRRPDRPDRDRFDRPPRREGGGDWQSRDRRPPSGDRSYPPREGGGPRPYQPRPRFDRPPGDEGGMSIRLDPRRLGTLKQLAAEAGMRPGDLVRQWVEERVDAARHGGATPAAAQDLGARLAELAARVAALEASAGVGQVSARPEMPAVPEPEPDTAPGDVAPEIAPADAAPEAKARTPRARAKRVSTLPASQRVPLHDEMTAVLAERGPMTAGELATAVAERGRYSPPRSGKPLDAAMISQRVSNPTYRSRFTRNQGRIGLAEPTG